MTSDLDFGPLHEAAQAEIDAGLRACQVAVARHGEVLWTESFGEATDDNRFLVMSATKPIVSSAAWLLMGDGALDIERRVVDYIPEFGANGKEAVTVEQVMIMTAGFPNADMPAADGADPEARAKHFAEWKLEYDPGTAYEYHASSAHWVIADLIERLTGTPYCDFVKARVTTPLGLPRVLGIPRSEQGDIVGIAAGEDPTGGMIGDPAEYIEVGGPAGGGVMRASDLALFYQGLLHNPGPIWDPAVLHDGLTNVRTTLPDPMLNMPANRTTGVVIGAGFGTTWSSSPTAFGWPGAGGQIGFAEPATGISFAFLQFGETDQIQTFVRGFKMSELALALGR